MYLAVISKAWRFVWRVLGRVGQFVGGAMLVIGRLSDPIVTSIGMTIIFFGVLLDVGMELIVSE